jgi:hypothetical protein
MKERWKDPEYRKKALENRPSVIKLQEILETGIATCIKCGIAKELEEFPKSRKKRSGNPRYAYCKKCHSETQRSLRLKKFFNLTAEEYDLIYKHQGGVCAICKQPPKGSRLAVDHDHKTGAVRGLLCPWCNRAIALFRDQVDRFENTVKYFHSYPVTEALGEPRFGLKGRVSNKAKTRNRLNPDLLERPKLRRPNDGK